MTELPEWTYSGEITELGDLSALEAALHSGRVSAAERGYTGEPEISTEEVMATGDPEQPSELLTAEQAQQDGLEFAPTGLRFRMVWPAELHD